MYAGFWKRALAFLIDIFIVIGFLSALSELVADSDDTFLVLSIPLSFFYWILFEGSSLQATPGKMALSIKVTNLKGAPIGFCRATGRNLAKVISYFCWGIGFIIAGFTRRKQALHDKIASCLVINCGNYSD